MKLSDLKVDSYYWLESKNTNHNRIYGYPSGTKTIGKFLGESDFITNMFLFYIVGTDVVQDFDDWNVVSEIQYKASLIGELVENIHIFTIKKKSYTDDDVPVYEDLFAVYLEKTAKGIVDAKNAQLSKEEIKEEVSYIYKRLLLKEY